MTENNTKYITPQNMSHRWDIWLHFCVLESILNAQPVEQTTFQLGAVLLYKYCINIF